jgi:hypothetical protein
MEQRAGCPRRAILAEGPSILLHARSAFTLLVLLIPFTN